MTKLQPLDFQLSTEMTFFLFLNVNNSINDWKGEYFDRPSGLWGMQVESQKYLNQKKYVQLLR